MSLTTSAHWAYNPGGDFYGTLIDGSARFERDDNQYLVRNFATGNRRTYTRSFWFKMSKLDGNEIYFYSVTTSNSDAMLFETDRRIRFSHFANTYRLTTSQKFRDVGAWYHIVERVDTTQGTASNRWRIYVNGVQVTAFDIANYPPQNYDTKHNVSGNAHHLMTNEPSSNNFSGYVAEYNYIDGQSLGPESFGQFKSGVWIPKEYSGSYGTNGFYLKFNGNGNDSSGNGNNYTANNLAAYDYVQDSPTNNLSICMWSDKSGPGTVLQGGLYSYVTSQGNYFSTGSSVGVKGGKWYYESRSIRGGNNSSGLPEQKLLPEGRYCNSNSNPTGSIAINVGTQDGSDGVYMIALDLDNGYVYRGRNGSWSNGATASGISSGSGTGAVKTLTSTEIDQYLRLCVVHRHDTGTSQITYNFGQDSTFNGYTSAGGNSDENGYGDFKYSVPTNFLTMCTQNLPAPEIDPAEGKSPQDYFNTVLYSGNGNTGQSITGVGFQPDFLWVKNRNMSGGYPHLVRDVVRGVTKRLRTNATDAEETANTVSSFDSDGFTFPSGYGNSFENDSAGNYVSWNWKAGGTAVSNTDGSITSSVSANTDAGFSIVTYTGNGTNTSTVGHGLSSAPEFVIVKSRSNSRNWVVEHNQGNGMYLNLTNNGASAGSNTMTQQASTIRFDVSNDGNRSVNFNGETYVAYCFHSVDGYCKIGSYTGGGDGTYIYTGFKPAFVIVKNYDTSSHHWVMYDNKRYGYNTIGPYLYANTTSTEMNATRVDFMSNGFVGRTSNYDIAQSGVRFIYIAFAEQPFKYANAR